MDILGHQPIFVVSLILTVLKTFKKLSKKAFFKNNFLHKNFSPDDDLSLKTNWEQSKNK